MEITNFEGMVLRLHGVTKRYFFASTLFVLTLISYIISTTVVTFGAPLFQNLPQPLVPHTQIQIDIKDEDVTLNLQRLDFWNGYVVFVGTATKLSLSACLSRSDFSLQLGDIQYEPATREKTRLAYGIDAPGTGFFIQCLSGDAPEVVLLPFVAPVNQADATIVYKNRLFKLPSSLEALKQKSAAAEPTATYTQTPTYTPTPTPTPTFTPAPAEILEGASSNFSLPLPSNANSQFVSGTVSNQGIKFTLERIDFWDSLPDGTHPINDKFIVFTGTLIPIADGSSSHCVGAADVELHIGQQIYQMDNMRSANQFYESDFPGYIVPQCVSSNTPVTTFFVYDAHLINEEVYLSLHNALLQVNLPPANLSAEAPTLRPTQSDDTASQPVATNTPVEVNIKKVTETPTVTTVSTGIVNNNANLRAGPGTAFDIIGSVEAKQSVVIVGSNSTQDWFQLADGAWIAAFLVTDLSMPIPTLPPTATPMPTATPNQQATSVAEEHAHATATIQAYISVPPEGIWCGQNWTRGVCVGDFRYTNEIDYEVAPNNGRFIAFVIAVKNISESYITANPLDITFVMEDGRTYAYSSVSFSYWAVPLEHVEIAPDNNAQGGIVFLIPNDVLPWKVIYRGGLFESAIEIDLHEPPSPEE